MKISVRNLEPTKVKLTVTVEPEELNPYLDAARKEIAKQVNVPGFRKGHVPGKIIDQRIGFAAVAGEAVNDAVPELYSKALDEKKIRPMAQPEFDVQDVPQSANDETKLKFTATVERRPDIELPEIDGLEIAISKPEVKDEDVDKRLETLRQRFGTLVGVDRPAAKGDFANIDLTAEIDGETVDSQEGVSYELGSNTMLDGLDEALDGLSAGEETTFEGTLEAGEHEGQKATVKVKVNSVKAEELPELNDEFASEASEFDTLDELKADIRKAAAQDAEGLASWDAAEPALPWPLIFTGMFFNNLYWWCTNQSFVQRALAAKSLKEGQKGAIYCGFLKTRRLRPRRPWRRICAIRWCSTLWPRSWTFRCPSPTCSTSSLPSPSSTAWIRTTSSRPSSRMASLAPLCRKSAVPRACSPACAPSSSPLMARLWTSPPSWARPLRTKSPSPSRPLPLLPPWPTNCPPRMTPRMLSEHSLIALA